MSPHNGRGWETAIIAVPYLNELLIFLQNALIRTAGTQAGLRTTGKQTTNFRNFATRFFG
jgi:hypothetical protein